LFPIADRVIATQPGNPRAATPEEILQAAGRTGTEIDCIAAVPAAMERGRQAALPEGVMVVTGSIYLVGEAMQVWGLRA
jgi:dihydrofolate synthase/folylpolyglutamate synthase